jgi:hypothetical protein
MAQTYHPVSFRAAKVAKLQFDGPIESRATGGTETRKTSNSNDLAIYKLKWHNEQLACVDNQIIEGDGTMTLKVPA